MDAKKLGRVFRRLKIIKSRLAWAIVTSPGSLAHRVHGGPAAKRPHPGPQSVRHSPANAVRP